MSDQFSSSKPNKKNDQHKAKAYAAFASSFAPLALDELVAEPPVDGARLNSVEGLAWVWLVNSGGGATSHIGAADKALAGIDGVGDVVDWLHKTCALVGFTSLAAARDARQNLHEAPHPSTSRGALYVEFARPACVAGILARLETGMPAPAVAGNIKHWSEIGLTMIEDFLSEEEEAGVLAGIRGDDRWRDELAKRQSMHAGPVFNYSTFSSDLDHVVPIPPYLAPLLPRLPRLPNEPIADQLTVQYYPPGTGIPPHVDTHSAFGESLFSLSLASPVEMLLVPCGPVEARRLRLPKRSLLPPGDSCPANPSSATGSRAPSPASVAAEGARPADHATEAAVAAAVATPLGPSYPLQLPARSLLVMTGPSRYAFTHGIASRKADQVGRRMVERYKGGRYSITFRSVRKEAERACACSWPEYCDWRIREEQAGAQDDAV